MTEELEPRATAGNKTATDETKKAAPTEKEQFSIKRFPYTPVLGWSVSRYDKFKTCKRQYYYDYYGKHDTEFTRKEIYKLKDLTSVPLEIGSIVHDVIRVLLNRLKKTAKAIDRDRFFDYAKRTATNYCQKKKFAEVYYKETETVDAVDVYTSVEGCLKNFLDNERYRWIFTEAVPKIDRWIIEPPGYGEARINNLKVYCKVDFLFPVGDTIYILDWKTGKPHAEKHRNQLLGYAAWASYHFDHDPAMIVPIIAYLQPVYKETVTEFNEFDIEEFSLQIEEQTLEMQNFCEDVEENIPKEKSEFPKTKIKRICDYCNYRELCSKPEVAVDDENRLPMSY